ncbi:rhodanese-like domain-containing protein [Tessaracoccus sp. OS52]|uniref:rhodanese-like domain-containing protein n=1 Tax=Tessaracoccus sp. OS52 TaxID=2886691 RepID=UPI001D1070E4|nr:rhodanese-like domain-containing protein [Tessaracoccus sp. OS52]MCC2594442.1 rhodanese-like domain-containing protein [Tessaracoccus sp. OS52]
MTEIQEVAISDLHAAHKRGDFILDVREPDEFAEGHVPSAVCIPLGDLPDRISEVPTDGQVYVVCRSGRRSLRGAETLAAFGIDAVSVRGGTKAWIAAGHPVSARPCLA